MTALFSHLQCRGMGGYLSKLYPKILNGNYEGTSGQSTCRVPCADEELVSQEMLQGDTSLMSNTKMCDTLGKGQNPRTHTPPIDGRWTRAQL